MAKIKITMNSKKKIYSECYSQKYNMQVCHKEDLRMKKKGLLKKVLFTCFLMFAAPVMLRGTDVYAAEGMNTNENGVPYYEDAQGVRYGFYEDGATCYVSGYADTISMNIVIPETITADGDEYTVTTIAENAFNDGFADSLDVVESIVLPETITSIEHSSLSSLNYLDELVIPQSVDWMDVRYLPSCPIRISEENSNYSSDDKGWIYNKDKTTLYRVDSMGEGTAEIPATVVTIAEYAVASTYYEEVIIPDSVQYIRESAFEFTWLTQLEIPSSVIEIGEYAFSGSELEKVTLNEGLKKIGNSAFFLNESLVEIVIPASVNSIDGQLFGGCSNLQKIEIATGSQYYCTDEYGNIYTKDKREFVCANPTQEKVTVSGNAECISDNAFSSCAVKEVVIEEGVEKIGAACFYDCENLIKITIPRSVDSIGLFAFLDVHDDIKVYGYRNTYAAEYFAEETEAFVLLDTLSSVTATKTKMTYTIGDKLNIDDLVVTAVYADNTKAVVKNYTTNAAQIDMTTVGTKQLIITYAENGIQKQTRITITVTKASGNSNQTSSGGNSSTEKPIVDVPDVGTKVSLSSGKYKVTKSSATSKEVAYTGVSNTKKTSVTIPATVKIDGYTYKVTEIVAKAFKNNKKIKSVTIGKNVKKIGKEAFSNCKKIKKITIKGSGLKSVGKNAIKNIDKKATIKVPKSKLKKYKSLFKSKTGYKTTMKIKK